MNQLSRGEVFSFLFIVIFSVSLVTVSSVEGKESFRAIGRKVKDGDSFVVRSKKKNIEIRLYGVDCPEYKQPYGSVAKRFLKKRVVKKSLKVTPIYYDKYGRLVAIVEQGGRLLNNDLVKAGLAWVYPRYCKKKICKKWKRQEKKARKANMGLWASSNPISPWKWKQAKWQKN